MGQRPIIGQMAKAKSIARYRVETSPKTRFGLLAFAGLLRKGQKKHALTCGYSFLWITLAHGLLLNSILLAFSPFIGKGQRPNQGQGQTK